MYTNRQTQTHEHKCHLIDVASQGAWPAEAHPLLEPRAERVRDAVDKRVNEDVTAREAGLGEVRDDDATDGVGVDEPSVEDEGDEMLVEDHGLEV